MIEGSTGEVARAGGRVDRVTLDGGRVTVRQRSDTHGGGNALTAAGRR